MIDKHEVIIDKDDWEEYQAVLKFFETYPEIAEKYDEFYKQYNKEDVSS